MIKKKRQNILELKPGKTILVLLTKVKFVFMLSWFAENSLAVFISLIIIGSLLGPGTLRFFSITKQWYFSIMVLFFFRLTMVFSHMTSSEKRMKKIGELDVFFRVYFACSCLLMRIYNRYYG